MFTDKFGGIELPHLPNIMIEENPNLFAIYAILEKKSKLYKFLYIIYCRKITCSRKCFFDEILGKFWLLKKKINFGSLGQISSLLVCRLNSEHNLESNY